MPAAPSMTPPAGRAPDASFFSDPDFRELAATRVDPAIDIKPPPPGPRPDQVRRRPHRSPPPRPSRPADRDRARTTEMPPGRGRLDNAHSPALRGGRSACGGSESSRKRRATTPSRFSTTTSGLDRRPPRHRPLAPGLAAVEGRRARAPRPAAGTSCRRLGAQTSSLPAACSCAGRPRPLVDTPLVGGRRRVDYYFITARASRRHRRLPPLTGAARCCRMGFGCGSRASVRDGAGKPRRCRGFRRRAFPSIVIVQDWLYWPRTDGVACVRPERSPTRTADPEAPRNLNAGCSSRSGRSSRRTTTSRRSCAGCLPAHLDEGVAD